jgi:hypothetical protein
VQESCGYWYFHKTGTSLPIVDLRCQAILIDLEVTKDWISVLEKERILWEVHLSEVWKCWITLESLFAV